MAVELSVVVCTYIRTHRLIECLKSLEKQTLDTNKFEVVIVTRGLKGENENNLNSFLKSTPLNVNRVRMAEDRSGVSAARNEGLANAKGRIIHFLDDDAIASPDCLKSYIEIFISTDAMCAGGKILPRFLSAAPSWLHPSLKAFLGTLNLGDKITGFHYPSSFPVGANVAFKREVFQKYGIFDERLGVLGSSGADADESDICYRILLDGKKLLYCPGALIEHCIEGDKLNQLWMLKRAYRQGKGAAMVLLKYRKPLFVLWNGIASGMRTPKEGFLEKASGNPISAKIFLIESKVILAFAYFLETFKTLLRG